VQPRGHQSWRTVFNVVVSYEGANNAEDGALFEFH